MSLFGDSPPGESPPATRSRALFSDDDEDPKSSSLFDDGDEGTSSPWDAPTPRRRSRAELVRSLLRPSDVPASYIEVFDKVLEDDDGGSLGKISPAGVRRVLASGRISAERQGEILGIVGAEGGEVGRNEFNVLLALVGLSQEGERVSLDAVDERKGGEFLSWVQFCSAVIVISGEAASCGCDLRLHFRWPRRAWYHWPPSLLGSDATVTRQTRTDWLPLLSLGAVVLRAQSNAAICGDSGPCSSCSTPPKLSPDAQMPRASR